jgi:hypothetical protein
MTRPKHAYHRHRERREADTMPSDALEPVDFAAMAEAHSWHLHELAEEHVQSWWDHYEGDKLDRLAPPMPEDLRTRMVEDVRDALHGVANPFHVEADFGSEGECLGTVTTLTPEANAVVAMARRRALSEWRTYSFRRAAASAKDRSRRTQVCLGVHRARESRRSAPGRFRGSRRTTASSRGSPDDDSGDSEPAGRLARPAGGAPHHHRLVGRQA